MNKLNLLAITLLLSIGTAYGQSDSASSPLYDYSALSLYQYHITDSIMVQSGFGAVAGKYLGHSKFVFEWQRDFLQGIRFRSRLNKDRFMSTSLVMAAAVAVPAWAMALGGSSEDQIEKMMVYVLAPFGSHIGYRPTRMLTLYAGVAPDIILFTHDNGLLLQARLGCRLDVNKGLVVNVGVARTALCSFKRTGRTFPTGISLGVSYAPPNGAWAD